MTRVLVIAEHDGTALSGNTARCVQCAQTIDPDVIDVAVLSSGADAIEARAAQISGVTRVLGLRHPDNAHYLAALWAPQIAELAVDYTHVFAPSSTFGKDLLPRVAAMLGVGQLSDIMRAHSPHTFERPIYAGNAIIKVEADPSQVLLATVRTASFGEAEDGNDAPIELRDTELELPAHTRFVGASVSADTGPELQSAGRVVSGGRGVGSAESFEMIRELCSVLGAAMGASRAAVDAGYVPNDLQVGQTGKVIAPELYVAVGISGAIQHVTGIKDAKTIVAINKDGEAPIFEVADIGIVGDLFKIVPELIEALKTA
jgi:electron transfer flavoprotein alpha subunit